MVLTHAESVRDRVRQSAVIREENGLSILTFHAMGTVCRVSLVEPTRDAANAFLDQLLNWVADFEAKYSRFIESSLVCRINAAAGKHRVELDEEAERLFSLAGEMSFFSRGAFDPTALPLIRLWNWKANPPVVPSDEAIQAARELVGWNKVERSPGRIFLPRSGMCVDLGGIGKEYAVDMAIAMAAQHGLAHVLVDFGQDVRAMGCPPGRPAWHVGLEDPKAPGSSWGSVAVTNQAVATSGDYLRHFVHEGKRYGHIIDPRTGYPVSNGCLTVSVIAPSCTIAGILTTTAFILGPHEAFNLIHGHFYASGAIVTEKGNFITPRFHEHLVQQN
ncbi:MAG TPA: FAD:protein FMN transferase [Candidatus Acidoferrum sp.]|nr:FAD:protein FMN transferase [Candidatus Acidoferrum sp.]